MLIMAQMIHSSLRSSTHKRESLTAEYKYLVDKVEVAVGVFFGKTTTI